MSNKIKEIESQIAQSSDPLQKLIHENRLAWEYSLYMPSKAIPIALGNQQKALILKNINEVGFALMALSNSYLHMSDYDNAFKYAFEANKILRTTANKRGEARSLNILGNAYFSLGNYEESLRCRFESLKIYESIDFEEGKILNLLNIGNVHATLNDFMQALKYYTVAIEYLEKRNDEEQLKSAYMNAGSVYAMQKNYEKALEYYALSSKLISDSPDIGDVNLYNNLAEVYFLKADFERSRHYYDLGLVLSKRLFIKSGEANALLGISKIEEKNGNYSGAQQLIKEGLELFRELKNNQGISECLLLSSEIFEKRGDIPSALTVFKQYNKVKEEMALADAEKKTRNLLVLHQVDELKKDADSQREINVELKKANREIENVNRNLLESISYAKHVQDAILPNEGRLKQYFPDSFLFSRPKDIVSGDFFWIYEKEDEILVASIDCTGHGVPGAFMSVVANSLLNQVAMNQWPTSPSFLLNELNFLVERGLTSKDDGVKDGMDIALCAFSKSKTSMIFSGAHSVIYVISDGSMKEFKGERISIGNTTAAYFNNSKVSLQKDDCIYLFTDGYIDQRGGANKNKFYYDPFKRMLLKIHKLPMEEQKKIVEQTMNEWIAGEKQLDDMQVIGIKI